MWDIENVYFKEHVIWYISIYTQYTIGSVSLAEQGNAKICSELINSFEFKVFSEVAPFRASDQIADFWLSCLVLV